MKIAFVVYWFPLLSETFILNQIVGLLDRGHEIDIYADYPEIKNNKLHSEIESYQLLQRTYYRPRWRSPRIYAILKGLALFGMNLPKAPQILLRSLNVFKYGQEARSMRLLYWTIPCLGKQPYDIIHCHFGIPGKNTAILREIGAIKGKLITSFHGADVHSYPGIFGANLYDPLFERGDLYTANTTYTKESVMKLGCPPDKIEILPVGLNPALYPFSERILQENQPIKIITVGRLVEKKGIGYSIRAVAKVIQDHPNIIYRIVGDGELREPLKQLILELGVSDKIQLLGWMTQEEVRQLYADSHLFILASVTASNGDREGQGLVLQEAQAMGLPVLSTLHNGIPDGVLEGKSGFLVPEKDVEALAERLTYLVKNPEKWSEMGRIGREFVEQNYDINVLNNQLVKIYENLLKKSS